MSTVKAGEGGGGGNSGKIVCSWDCTKHEECRKKNEENDKQRYLKMPFKEWDGNTMIYSDLLDEYFENDSDLEMNVEDRELKYEDLRLIICEPVELDPVDPDIFWEDFLPEDCTFSDVASQELRKALNDLNEFAKKEKPWVWEPGNYRTEYKGEKDE